MDSCPQSAWPRAGIIATAALAVCVATSGCSKPRNAPQQASATANNAEKAGSGAVAAANNTEKPAAKRAAQAAPAVDQASATANNQANKPAAAAAKKRDRKKPSAKKYSVVPHFSRGKSTAFELPIAGKSAKIRLLPIDDLSHEVTTFDPVQGAEMLAVVVRSDGWYARRQSFEDIPEHGGVLALKFPKAGAHVAWVVFQPKGERLITIPTFFNVQGKESAPAADPENGRLFRAGKLEVALSAAPTIGVCTPFDVATMWSKRSRAVALDTAPTGASVSYIALDAGGTTLIVGTAKSDPKKGNESLIGDSGSYAKLQLTRPGRWYVWAFAGRKNKRWSARFWIDAKGTPMPDGCPEP